MEHGGKGQRARGMAQNIEHCDSSPGEIMRRDEREGGQVTDF